MRLRKKRWPAEEKPEMPTEVGPMKETQENINKNIRNHTLQNPFRNKK